MAACGDARDREEESAHRSGDIDDLTSCSICFEVFTEPKYLPCLHTFCEHCLQSYITKIEETEGVTSGFKCPLCRRFVPAPGTVDRASEWASMLPVNHFINTLMDRNKLKSGVRLCQPCQRENESESATKWCRECMEALCDICCKCHNKLAVSKTHIVVPIDKIAFDDIQVQTDMIKCKEHLAKNLEFYCFDHDAPCCITCVTLLHRKCEHVDTMELASKEFRGKSHVRAILKNLEEDRRQFKKGIDLLTENVQDIETDAEEISSDITNIADDLILLIKNLKEKSLSDVNQTKKSKIQEQVQSKEIFENSNSLIENYLKMLTVTERHGSTHRSCLNING